MARPENNCKKVTCKKVILHATRSSNSKKDKATREKKVRQKWSTPRVKVRQNKKRSCKVKISVKGYFKTRMLGKDENVG